MKVLIISNLFPNNLEPNRATFNYQQISELSRLCNVVVIAPISWLVKLKYIIKWRKFQHYAIQTSEVKAYYPTYFYTPKFMRCMYGFFYFISIFFRATILIYREKPNVLLGTWAYPDGFATVLFGMMLGVPVAIKVHGSDIHSVSKGCRLRMTSWALKKANLIISVSQNLANTMEVEFGIRQENVVVIQNGVDTDKFYPIDKELALSKIGLNGADIKNIMFIGNLKSEKSPLTLLYAFSQLINESSLNIKLHFIGDGPLRKDLELEIDQLGLNNDALVHGAIAHTEIPIWLNAADIFVLPSLNEGMPNVVLEALACNTPVVASNVGGIPEIMEDGINGILFQSGNAEQLAEKLHIALQKKWDEKIFAAHSKEGTWEKTAEILIQNLKQFECNN